MAAHKTSLSPTAAALFLALMCSSTASAARQLGGTGSTVVQPFPDPPPPAPQKKGEASPPPPRPPRVTPAAPSPYIIQVPSGRPSVTYPEAPPPLTYWPSVLGNY
ncbi:hypothetical protein PVAP13_3NG095116 [Panicum virgatum]|uniref:Uncharacterized protein n=1 Tax=Panicum virgatum TaxID=38727 RepID=A0A8T0U135_PANVG|nr:hypothetical protein PVAP13_3NG095116 [Panicum virgatum]